MNAAIKESAIRVDILVIGGGTAGSVAAIKAKEGLPEGEVLLLEKANVKRSGAIALGMDGVNNAVVPGHATPEQYVKEITNTRTSSSGCSLSGCWACSPAPQCVLLASA
ncbi:MAG: FAD-binding protein [Terrimicrobiaceae bacterium]